MNNIVLGCKTDLEAVGSIWFVWGGSVALDHIEMATNTQTICFQRHN